MDVPRTSFFGRMIDTEHPKSTSYFPKRTIQPFNQLTMPKLTGKCACGAVSYILPDENYNLGACHCDTCRQWTSGIMFSLTPSKPQFQGQAHISVYESSPKAERAFCKICGSSLYFKEKDPDTIYICAGTLDGYPPDLKLVREVYVDASPKAYALEKTDRLVLKRANYDK